MQNTVSARKSVQYAVFLLLRGCKKLDFKASGLRFLAYFVELCHDLSDLHKAVKVRSSQCVGLHEFHRDSCFIYMK